MFIEKILFKKQLYALIVRSKEQFKKKGINFVTNEKDFLQVGFLKHNKNHHIKAHSHKKRNLKITFMSECLLIKKGELNVIFYDNKGKDIKKNKILKKNDIILLIKGGHGFKVNKNSEIIEIKQGPYIKVNDKKLFE
jgi:cupin fold WbuC family metalloprotein